MENEIKRTNTITLPELLQMLENAQDEYLIAKNSKRNARNNRLRSEYEQQQIHVISRISNLLMTFHDAPKPVKANFLGFQHFEDDLADWITLIKQILAE